jgi:hypothetical protein
MRSRLLNPSWAAVLGLVLFLHSACATTPAPAPPPEPEPVPAAAPPTPPAPPPIPVSRLICTVETGRRIDLAGLGLPEGSRPVALALGKETMWLLFEPALLVGLPREVEEAPLVAIAEFGAVEEIDLIPGPAGAAWSDLTVDSWDGSVWIAAEKTPGLWRKRPGRRPEPVRLPQARLQGGFRDLLAGRGSVWVAPACADNAVWRLDAAGKLLGQAFPGETGSCPAAALALDWSGTAWALRPDAGTLFRLGFDQTWQPAGPEVPVLQSSAGRDRPFSWFFWGTEPIGLAGDEAGGEAEGGSLLYRNVGGRTETFREDCGEGNALVGVAGDERGWAVLTRQWLRLADHQRAEEAAPGE